MATVAQGRFAQTVHVFDELECGGHACCELCSAYPAAYHWSEQRQGKASQQHDLIVCRICAGMILLIRNSK